MNEEEMALSAKILLSIILWYIKKFSHKAIILKLELGKNKLLLMIQKEVLQRVHILSSFMNSQKLKCLEI